MPRYYNAGRQLKRDGVTWFDITDYHDWEEWSGQQTKDQLRMLKRGMDGYAYPPELLKKPEPQTGGLFPFGRHKDWPMNKVPLDYYDWCSKQDWIIKWPTVLAFITEHRLEIEKAVKELEEGHADLKKLAEELRK